MIDSLKHINLKYLEEVSEGDRELLKEMLIIFIKQVPELIEKMNVHYTNKDWYALGKIVHKAKSSVSIMGMEKMIKFLKTFENLTKEAKNTEQYPEYIKNFSSECNSAVIEAKNISLNL